MSAFSILTRLLIPFKPHLDFLIFSDFARFFRKTAVFINKVLCSIDTSDFLTDVSKRRIFYHAK